MRFLKFSKRASIISLCDIKKIGFDNWDKVFTVRCQVNF
jgi:hypothetical protein